MKKLLLMAGWMGMVISTTSLQAQDDLYYLEINGEDTTINRELFTKYLNEHPFENRPRMTKAEWKKVPKEDRPDLAWEQDFLRTMDPKTGRPMTERLFPILASMHGGSAQQGLAPGGGSSNQWTERGPNNVGGRTRALMFDPNDATHKKVWAGGVTGGLWVNNDITSSTSTWTAINDFWANIAITCIAYDPNNTNVMYVGTGEGWGTGSSRGAGIWKTTNGGTTWTQLTSTTTYYYVNDIVVRDEGTTSVVFAAVNQMSYRGQFHGPQGLFRSTNGGTSWSQVLPNTGSQPHAPADIEIAKDNRIWVGTRANSFGSGGGKVLYSDNGTTWTTSFTHPNSARRVELSCAPSDSAVVYGIVEKSSKVEDIIKTTNHGTTWLRSATSANLTEPNDADNGIPATDFTRNQAWYDLISVVNPNDEDDVIVGGIDLFRSTDGGKTWTQISKWSNNPNLNTLSCPLVHADQHMAIYRPGTTKELLFGNDGGVYYCSDVTKAHNTFNIISARNSGYNVTQFYAGAIHPNAGSNNMIAGSQDNGTQRFTAAGMNSTSRPIGGDGAFCHIDQTNGSYQAGSYVYNSLYRSTNSGAFFSRFINDVNTGRFINPSDYDNSLKILYTCKTNSEIYRFSNFSGASISTSTITVTGMTAKATAMTVSPNTTASTTIFVGNSSGQLFKMTNANATPVVTDMDPGNTLPSSSISCIEVGTNDNELLVTFFNYGTTSVWYTSNGGTSWVSKEGNLPDMPVRWAMYNPRNRKEVILATEIGVWATTDITVASPTWVASNNGLANVRVDMLQYRTSDSLVMAITHGRGVFTGRFKTPSSGGGSKPVPSYTTNRDTICAGDSVLFTSTTTNNPTSVEWTFTGGSPATANASPVQVTYNAAGSYAVKLKATNSSGSDSITTNNKIFVRALPTVNLPNPGPFCSNDSPITLSGGTPTGGTYLLNGFTVTTFDPTTAGVGNYTLEYQYTDANGCKNSDMKTIVVNAHPTAGATTVNPVCENAPAFALTNGTPSGGVYSGPGVSAGQFDPSVAGAGAHSIQYKFTNSNQCSDSTTFSLTVNAKPTVTFTGVGPFCSGDTAQLLTQGSPSGGTYSGPGVTNGRFDPSAVGVGSYTLKYVFTDANGCSDSATTSVSVSNGVSVTLAPFADLCGNEPSFILTGGLPNGGTYSGPGVSGGIFDPAVAGPGTHTITYTHLLGCGGGAATETIKVDSFPNLVISNDTFVCVGESVQISASGATSYSWSPAGSLIGSSSPSPVATPTVTTVYTVTGSYANSCSAKDSVRVIARPLPNVNAGPDTSACAGTPFQLQASGAISYTWIPPVGLSSTTVSNPVATINTNQTYIVTGTDAFGCSNTDVINLTVLSAPNVSLTLQDSVCEETPPFTLNGGTPTGGLYTGSGVINGVFDPKVAGLGTHFVYYSVAGSNGCSAADTQKIEVTGPPTVNWIQAGPFCNGDSPTALQASPSGGTFSGPGVSSGNFDPSEAGEGNHVLTYEVTDANGCTTSSEQKVRVFPASPIDSIQGFFHVVQNQSYNYLVNAVNGASYTWQAISGTIMNTQSNGAAIRWGAGPTGEIEVVQVTANGCRDTTREIVYISILGTEEFELAGNKIRVYPNPATDQVRVRFETALWLNEVNLYLYNASGQELYKASRSNLTSGDEWVIDALNLDNGMYFLHLESNGNRIQAPVIIQK
ncbi:T9SS type A sorting domain-containing protein [bacterium SCSIO 12741]|nr:T9SS type A sorting domain-containing protein [bacterium SCSIO 12741]